MTIKPKIINSNIVVQEFEKELLLYDLITNKAFCLNETSAFIWQLCDGTNSTTEISRQLSKHFKANLDENFVWLAIEQFKRDGLLDESIPIEIDFGGLSRRQMIKKVGLATMIALPLISSIIAPIVAMAASSCFPPFATLPDSPIITVSSFDECNSHCLALGSQCCSGIATIFVTFKKIPLTCDCGAPVCH